MASGILYSCSGERHVAEAMRSARSSLAHNRLPHVMFASPLPEQIPFGLEVRSFAPSGNPYLDKINHIRTSPFDRTIFLDSDTFVAGDIGHVFDLLDHHDLAAALAGAQARYPIRPDDISDAFYEFNTGVLAWRQTPRAAKFLNRWEERYREAPLNHGPADQIAFRQCAWDTEAKIAVLGPEYNCRITRPLAVVGPVYVLHGHRDDLEQLATRLNRRETARAFTPAPYRRRAQAAERLKLAGPVSWLRRALRTPWSVGGE